MQEVESTSFRTFEAYLVATVLYLGFSLVIMFAGALLARRFQIAEAR